MGKTTSAQNQAHMPTQPRAHPLWLGCNECPTKAGEVNRHVVWYTSPYPWSRSLVLNAWMKGLASGDQRRPTGSSSALEALCDDVLYKFIYFTSHHISRITVQQSTTGCLHGWCLRHTQLCCMQCDLIAVDVHYFEIRWKRVQFLNLCLWNM